MFSDRTTRSEMHLSDLINVVLRSEGAQLPI